jgi:Mrp family chromosome partitioning ATPase
VELATVERLGAETVVTNSAAGEAIVEHDPIEAAEPRIIRLPHVEPSDDEVALQDRAPTNAFPGETPVFIGATQRIAFFSLKGGVGRTTLATEAAALLARDARHRAAVGAPPERLRVALLDIDMGSANVSMKLGLTHPTLWDLVIEPAPTADSVDRCLLEHDDSGLRVLLGPPRAISGGESRAIAMQRIAQVLHHLDEQNFQFSRRRTRSTTCSPQPPARCRTPIAASKPCAGWGIDASSASSSTSHAEPSTRPR